MLSAVDFNELFNMIGNLVDSVQTVIGGCGAWGVERGVCFIEVKTAILVGLPSLQMSPIGVVARGDRLKGRNGIRAFWFGASRGAGQH